jgi:rhamnosyltransferase
MMSVTLDERRSEGVTPPVSSPRCSVGAVIVLFHPDWAQTRRQFEALRNQVAQIVLVDNTPDSQTPALRLPDRVSYLPMGENTGIAHAQNRGAHECERNGPIRLVVFFDQDSEIPNGLVAVLLQGYSELTDLGHRVAAIGPRPFDVHRQRAHVPLFSIRQRVGPRFSLVSHLLSSGTLVPLEAFHEIGPFDESLFIDSVDQEWGWRANSRGWLCIVDESARLSHRMGVEGRSILGLRFTLSTPARLYYQFRNAIRLLLYYRDPHPPLHWVLKRLLTLPIKFLYYSVFSPPRFKNLKFMLAGAIDGVVNRSGAPSSDL